MLSADAKPGPSYTIPYYALLRSARIFLTIHIYNGTSDDVLFVKETVDYVTRNETSHNTLILASKYSLNNSSRDALRFSSDLAIPRD